MSRRGVEQKKEASAPQIDPKVLEPRPVNLGGEAFVFDPDTTCEQDELLEPLFKVILNDFKVRAIQKAENGEVPRIMDGIEASRRFLTRHEFRQAMAIILIPEGKEFSASAVPVIRKKLDRLKGEDKIQFYSLGEDFLTLADSACGFTEISSAMESALRAEKILSDSE